MAAEGQGAVVPLPAPSESGCSDEFALDCTFAACDPERTGLVQPQRVVAYVAAVTGHSGQHGRLRALRRALDPSAAGAALDRARFGRAMGAWIAACRRERAKEQDLAVSGADPDVPGPADDDSDDSDGDDGDGDSVEGRSWPAAEQLQGDNGDITEPAEAAGLRSRALRLAEHNSKLQWDAEQAEERSASLARDMQQLQAQLRSRQALEQARAAAEELEDVRGAAKRLEEENAELRQLARHADREQRSLHAVSEGLQDENQRLQAELRVLREQLQAQAERTASLEAQLCRGTALLAARDAALAQAGQRAQELMAALEEYERVVQELRQETMRLRQQLGQLRDAWAMRPWCPRGHLDIPATAPPAIQGTGDKEEEEEEGSALAGVAGSDRQVTEAVPPWWSPWWSFWSPWWSLWSLWALALLALLTLLYLLPQQWPQPHLRHRSPPPL